MIHAILEEVGIATTVTIFAIIFRMIFKKIPEMHNHSYQVNLLLRAADKERKMRKMGRCFKMRKMWKIQKLQILERRDKAERTGRSERNRNRELEGAEK